MSAAELMHRASAAGIEMVVSQDGCLQLRAVHPPSDNLLAELAAHKIEIIIALNAANDSMLSSVWLSRVARLLDTRPDVLLEEGHLEPHDLVELAGADVVLVADTIRASPAWINRSQRVEQSAEVHAAKEVVPHYTVHTAATTSQAWREADAAHTNHLMSCCVCHAATSRYCAAGFDLRQRYNNTPMEASE
ncbi:hypothetical protein [Pseudomonas fluorescens]|uniref:TubC N-terminal docking domain-containing protein n=1 Tax=Pseudomonas fluorescens TaxID=294 RepID=A0A5E6S2Q0_PSEFL|nr:hypothetical protein [Pseudomonas fluorescens]VVM75324.1 hypothetical protein PS659_02057 [Pseudomonas fluorescens]